MVRLGSLTSGRNSFSGDDEGRAMVARKKKRKVILHLLRILREGKGGDKNREGLGTSFDLLE